MKATINYNQTVFLSLLSEKQQIVLTSLSSVHTHSLNVQLRFKLSNLDHLTQEDFLLHDTTTIYVRNAEAFWEYLENTPPEHC